MKIVLENNDVIKLVETYKQVNENYSQSQGFTCSIMEPVKDSYSGRTDYIVKVQNASVDLLDNAFCLNKGTFRHLLRYIGHISNFNYDKEENSASINVKTNKQGFVLEINGNSFTIDKLRKAAIDYDVQTSSGISL